LNKSSTASDDAKRDTPKTENAAPKRAHALNESAAPKRLPAKTARAEPSRARPNKAIEDPSRPTLRNESEEPKREKSSRLIELPLVTVPNTDKAEAKRLKLRSDKALPNLV
jgi:hypothetical protein